MQYPDREWLPASCSILLPPPPAIWSFLCVGSDADELNGKTDPRTRSGNETEPEKGSSVLRALRLNVCDKELARPTQNKRKKQNNQKNTEVDETG
jgi:hypothetical protein